MAPTPPRAVHWDVKELLHSPVFEGSTESYISTSSLEYVNAQIVAHGFAPAPGLSLDGLSGTDSDRVVKCLLSLLGQRMEDMSRTEELSTKLRTLTYDHERILTMHRISNEKLANAEREVNLHKAKLTATQRTLQSAESAHKQTSAELQRTRTNLQGIRATHQQELKKKEKDFERMADKWNKLADVQAKLTSVPAGLRCANAAVIDGTEHLPKTPRLLDTALDEAENARVQLTDEVARLRRLVVKVCNQVQAMLYQIQGFVSGKDEEPPILSVTNLFPMHPPTHAHDTLSSILRSLKDTLAILPQHIASSPATQTTSQSTTKSMTKPTEPDPEEITRLQVTIAKLQEQVEHSRKQAQLQATQNQELFENFIASHQKTSANIAEMSMELMTAPMADAERERLDKIKRELDKEREKFTQAAIKLGKERAALEADKKKLLDEKRSWEVQQVLADLPPTPDPLPAPKPKPKPRTQAHKSPRKPILHSPSRRSPRKGHKRQSSASSSHKGARVTRKTSITFTKPAVVPAYETEVIMTTSEPERVVAAAPAMAPPPLLAPCFSLKPATSILPSFVLPPPSPHASLPRRPLLPPSTQIEPPTPQPADFLLSHLPPPSVESTPFPSSSSSSSSSSKSNLNSIFNSTHSPPEQIPQIENRDASDNPMVTPMKRPFPVAKPFAQRMSHAYSPVKPSPLSRILMLNNDSPNSYDNSSYESSESTIGPLAPAAMDIEQEGILLPETPAQAPERKMSLAAELGVESPPDIVDIGDEDDGDQYGPPLKKRKSDGNGNERATSGSSRPTATTVVTRTRKPIAGAKERQSTRTTTGTTRGNNVRGGNEKENTIASTKVNGNFSSASATTSNTARTADKATTIKSTASRKASVAAPTKAKASTTTAGGVAGPRRVPINSAEAPVQIGRRKS